ncbi:MAG: helix-turn-helix transcriptional regulator [Alphaproteobacteria bacterium]|nr:helix-turn-helix transcriptional regulator [Alphaproteobacteria bacterium]
MIDPRDAGDRAFGLAEDYPVMETPWHAHDRPQLLYARSGCLRLRTARDLALLPPLRAAWIPGGLSHQVTAGRPAALRTVYFPPEEDDDAPAVVVFDAPPLLRELVATSCAWGLAPPDPALAQALHGLLRRLLDDWRTPAPGSRLPAPASPALQEALDWVFARLAFPVGLEDAARVAGWSHRTFQRRCREELGVPFSAWLAQARVLRATELLADPSLSVGEVANGCGFASQGAFSRSFAARTGLSPLAWRRAYHA